MNLRVMTYNIRHGRGRDGRIDLGRIADVIASFEPDVVALQELDIRRARSAHVDQPEELARRLGMDVRFAPCIVNGREHYGIATLARFPLDVARIIVLPRKPHRWRSEPRCALVTRIAWPLGSTLDVVNTHLSTVSRERGEQIAAIACGLDSDETILLGDFNCTTNATPFRSLCTTLRNATRGARSWPARLPMLAIDHILVRGPLDVVHAGAWISPIARRASDHLPVVAELSYRRALP
ncbi:MAG: endonuclease/exonuclease/phosphatase family protein [Deltaproteobacteria bacterium]|nr:endonuclease/exonuclease/phosphatase family protein [Deltaproteobacteria bacterium]MCW5804899.1 endonuclease/exonuclease/phosphatase family protein [Deltaproteobacteria bacterium]